MIRRRRSRWAKTIGIVFILYVIGVFLLFTRRASSDAKTSSWEKQGTASKTTQKPIQMAEREVPANGNEPKDMELEEEDPKAALPEDISEDDARVKEAVRNWAKEEEAGAPDQPTRNELKRDVAKVDAGHMLEAMYKILGPPHEDALRSVHTQIITSGGQEYILSRFLTRLYNISRVKEAGKKGPQQLLSYFKHSRNRLAATVQFSQSIIDIDNRAAKAIVNGVVEEVLLLVFNDWDHGTDKYLSVLEEFGKRIPLIAGAGTAVPSDYSTRFTRAQISPDEIGTLHQGAFAEMWSQLISSKDLVPSEKPHYHFFLWPGKVMNATKGPFQMMGAIRPVDFDGMDFLGHHTFEKTLQSPTLFFCSQGTENAVPFRGVIDVEHVAKFVATHTVSSLHIKSEKELLGALSQFDQVALIVSSGEAAAPMLEALLDSKTQLRRSLRSVVPTFFAQQDILADTEWKKLKVLSTQDIQPESLRHMAGVVPETSPSFPEELRLPPPSDTTRLLLLNRVHLSKSGTSLADFVVRVVRFPGPQNSEDALLWSLTVGSHLTDMLRDSIEVQPFLTDVTGLDLQNVFEQHFGVLYSRLEALWRQPLMATSTSTRKSDDAQRLVVVVRSHSVHCPCKEAARVAASQVPINGPTRIVTTISTTELTQELRFVARLTGSNPMRPAAADGMCEVYLFNREGHLWSLDAAPEEVKELSTNKLLRQPRPKTVPHTVAQPSPQQLRKALEELRDAAKESVTGPLHSTMQEGTDGTAPWYLWVPPYETAPFAVHSVSTAPRSVGATQRKATDKVSFLLIHDSSCGVSTNNVKAFRLLASCQRNGTLDDVQTEFVEYDVSESFFMSSANGQLLRSAQDKTTGRETPHKQLYDLLMPFLQDSGRLQPPQIVASNATHVLSTLGTSNYYRPGKNGLPNGHVQGLARIASYMDPRLNVDHLLESMQNSLTEERQRRDKFRKKGG